MLQAARVQADVAERHADGQFKLEDRREDREGEVAVGRVRKEEERVTVEQEKAKSAVKIRTLEILGRLYQANPKDALLYRIYELGVGGAGGGGESAAG